MAGASEILHAVLFGQRLKKKGAAVKRLRVLTSVAAVSHGIDTWKLGKVAEAPVGSVTIHQQVFAMRDSGNIKYHVTLAAPYETLNNG